MIDLVVKSVFQNSTRIDAIARTINKVNKQHMIGGLMLAVTIWSISKVVQKHEEQLNSIEATLKEMKSKGE